MWLVVLMLVTALVPVVVTVLWIVAKGLRGRRLLHPKQERSLPSNAPSAPLDVECERQEIRARQDEIVPPPTSSAPPPNLENAPDDDSLEAFVARAPAFLVRLGRPRRVVFLHGFAGFAEVGVGPLTGAYFRGVGRRLRERGVDASFVRVSPFGSLLVRAAELSSYVRELGRDRVHLVAHSMGGLDARFALANLGLREHVASLVTVATPHAGTPLADVGSRLLGASRKLSSRLASVLDLTTSRLAAFDSEAPDAPDVTYACILASPHAGLRGVGPLLVPSYAWLKRRAGDNDGVVPVSSQVHGRVLGHIDADHWGAVGWGRFDAVRFYDELATTLLDGRLVEAGPALL
jgi:triacylglycerol lipase